MNVGESKTVDCLVLLLFMAQLLKTRRYAGEVMDILAAGEKEGILTVEKVGRNQPCPCGSGKKYKHCHGKTQNN